MQPPHSIQRQTSRVCDWHNKNTAGRHLAKLSVGGDRKPFEDLVVMAAVVVENIRDELTALRHRFKYPSDATEDGEQ